MDAASKRRRRLPLTLGIVASLALIALCVVPAAYTLIISVTRGGIPMRYRRWNGAAVFTEIFEDHNFFRHVRNSFMVFVNSVILFVAVGIPAVIGLSRLKRVWLRFAIAGLLFLPYLFTFSLVCAGGIERFGINSGMSGTPIWMYMTWVQGIYMLPLLVTGMLVLCCIRPMRAHRLVAVTAIIAVACAWYSSYNGSSGLFKVFQSVEIAKAALLPSYQYRITLNGSYGTSLETYSAVYILGGIIGKGGVAVLLLPLAALLAKGDFSVVAKKRYESIFVVGALPAVIMAASSAWFVYPIAVRLGRVPYDFSPHLMRTLINGLQPLIGTTLGTMLAVGLYGVTAKRRGIWYISISIALLGVTMQSVGAYYMRTQVGANEWYLPYSVGTSAAIALLAVGNLLPKWEGWEDKIRRVVMIHVSLFLLLFAMSAGDPSYDINYQKYIDRWSVAMLHLGMARNNDIRWLLIGPADGSRMSDTLTSILVPAYMVTMFISIAGAIALIVASLRPEKSAKVKAS